MANDNSLNINVPDGSVIITPTAMYHEIQAMHQEIRTLAGLVDPTLGDLRSEVKKLQTDVDSLKNWRAAIAGALTLLAALVSYGLVTFVGA